MTSEAADAPDDQTSDRRRFLRRSGAAAGAAWVAPVVLSAQAGAGVLSPANCCPEITSETISPGCPSPRILTVEVTVPQGCSGWYFAAERRQGGGPWVVTSPCQGPATQFSTEIPLDVTSDGQGRILAYDSCAQGATPVAELTTAVYPGCN